MQTHLHNVTVESTATVLRRLVCAVLLAAATFCHVHPLAADQAQYFYDELGRLIGVVDGQNNAAVYNYDEVGNLLKIDRFTTAGGNVGIFLVTPGSSLVNKPVEIRGFGYTTPASSNTVSFNGTNATVVSGTSSSLLVTVPIGATTGPITVTNANGTAASPQPFKVLVPPIVTDVDPTKVPQGVTSRLLIKGFNLKTASSVQFTQAGLTATIQSGATDDVLPLNVAVTGSVPPGSYAFSVTTPSGTAQSGTVKVTVATALPGFNTTKLLTIQMPLNTSVPATSQPIGPSASTTKPTTVHMSLNTTVPATSAPVGPSSSTTASTTIQMPLSTAVPATVAPTGPSFDVSPVTTVGMP
jgi:YD repeat-containing protein